MRKLWTAVLGSALMAVLGALPASADPIVGAYSISGNFAWVDNDTGLPVASASDADAIDFKFFLNNTPSPGDPGQFIILNASGDFVAFITLPLGEIKDFTFDGAGNTDFPSVPVAGFQTFGVGPITFDLTEITSVTANGDSLEVRGVGIFHLAGFDDTPGAFLFTGQESGGSFSFSASQSTAPVPEPATLLLLGAGLVAAGVLARKRR